MALVPMKHVEPIGFSKLTYENKTVNANSRLWIANITTSMTDNDIIWGITDNSNIIPYFAYSGNTIQLYLFNSSTSQQTANVKVYYGMNVMS